MSIEMWIPFVLASTLILVIPGPTIILLISQAVTHGRWSVIPLVTGVLLGDLTSMTLSFLGLGMPITKPSLGSLINAGFEYVFSGSWWITFFPGILLVTFTLVIILFGDWLRDVLNPKLYKG